MRIITVSLLVAFMALASSANLRAEDAAVDQDVQKALAIQKELQETVKKVLPAYLFYGNGGSAVCISPDGYFITNNHVAGRARRTNHVFSGIYAPGGKKYSCRVIWYDSFGDIALCKLDLEEGEQVPWVPLGDCDQTRVGDHAIAIGNPFSLGSDVNREPTVTFGVVTGVRRVHGNYTQCIQTDAPVNPGNSGGPLFNMRGEVIGINGMINSERERGRVSVGIGYAVSSNRIKRFIEFYNGKFEKGGETYHGIINGLSIDREPLGRNGGKVSRVAAGSTAEKAGFQEGDIVVDVEGYDIPHPAQVLGVIMAFPAGYELSIKVEREGELSELKVKLDKYQRTRRTAARPPVDPNRPFLGVGTVPATEGGLEVTQVVDGSGAAKAGIEVGDVIVKIDDKKVSSSDGLGNLLGKYKIGDKVKITVIRDGEEKVLDVTLGKRP